MFAHAQYVFRHIPKSIGVETWFLDRWMVHSILKHPAVVTRLRMSSTFYVIPRQLLMLRTLFWVYGMLGTPMRRPRLRMRSTFPVQTNFQNIVLVPDRLYKSTATRAVLRRFLATAISLGDRILTTVGHSKGSSEESSIISFCFLTQHRR
ncbi:hypothetical protein AVEN_58507-1 [Araneus ventricosus]|uniref:Uncharacterized protein n=1 Tax=Araneus ventricosus TaxID=182803 RepID=A0A4Y2IAL5_ARAVE|nr:hypothetical protein AVEN_58507-1 [Araneus ventricosus]